MGMGEEYNFFVILFYRTKMFVYVCVFNIARYP